jgi:hypothetical protein
MALSKEKYINITHAAHKHAETQIDLNGGHFHAYYDSYERGATAEAERSASLLSTLASIKSSCEACGKPMDLVLQSIWNQCDKAEREYNETKK